jgi:transcriptional regulator GlxA family with amidase domain
MVDQHSIEPAFDVDALAARCKVSRRTLDRIYARHDLSPAQEIRRSRAQRAIPLLAESMTLTLEEVATASGFGSITTMNRALKWAYGLSAAALRRVQAPSYDRDEVPELVE